MAATEIALSAVVMTHPRRRAAADGLVRRHPGMGFRVVADPDPGGPPSALRAALPAWRSVGPEATHHVVVQDDMLLTDDFADRCRLAAAARPDDILCLFTEWGSRTSHAVRLAAMAGAAWTPVLDPYIPTTALVLPADRARGLAEHAEADPDPPVADDVAVLRYAVAHGLTPLVGVPNLAEHEAGESLVGNDILMGPRRSALWAGDVAAAPGGGTVCAPTLLPHLLMFEGVSVFHVGDGAGGWRVVRAHDYLAPSGVSTRDLLGWYAADVARLDRARRMRDVVADSVLFQFWLTCLGYGLAAAGLPDELSTMDEPLAAAGLRTLAPGSLRRYVPRARLAGLPELLNPLVREAMSAGLAHGREYGPLLWKETFQ